MKTGRLVRRVLVAVAIGSVLAGSVAFAATLPVTSARITTSNSSVTVAATTCVLNPSADATLDRGSQNTNFGALSTLAVRSQNGNRQRRSILRFDIASCGIAPSAVVRSADLQVVPSSGPGANRTYNVHRVSAAWNELTVTYANQPAFVAGSTASVATGVAPTSLSWSVLTDVSAFVANTATNNGWLVKDAVENDATAPETIFGSRENGTASNWPVLTITYYP